MFLLWSMTMAAACVRGEALGCRPSLWLCAGPSSPAEKCWWWACCSPAPAAGTDRGVQILAAHLCTGVNFMLS